MRKFLTSLILLAFVAILATTAYFSWLPRSAPPSAESVAFTPERLGRGDYLFNAVLGCPVCHSDRDFSQFGAPPQPPFGGGRACMEPGKEVFGPAVEGGLPGTICFRNITPHASGIGTWSDGEILRAMREGIDHDGNALFPIMPAFIYRHLSDEDARSVLTYVRQLEPVDNTLPDTDVNFPLSWLMRLLPRPLEGPVDHPDESDPVAYGQYLATVARCAFCHSPRDPANRQAIEGMEFSGGVAFFGRDGVFYSTNLTPHASGLGDTSQDEFIALFRRESDPSRKELNLMPWTYFGKMTDPDLAAIYAYLQTVPAIEYTP
jgi:mono/diheme cytochrome c family protein